MAIYNLGKGDIDDLFSRIDVLAGSDRLGEVVSCRHGSEYNPRWPRSMWTSRWSL